MGEGGAVTEEMVHLFGVKVSRDVSEVKTLFLLATGFYITEAGMLVFRVGHDPVVAFAPYQWSLVYLSDENGKAKAAADYPSDWPV